MTEMERRVEDAFTGGQREHEREGDGQRPSPDKDGAQESERRDDEAAHRQRGVVRSDGEIQGARSRILYVTLSGDLSGSRSSDAPRGARSVPGMGPG